MFKNYGGAISVDGWTDKYKKIHYFGVSIHYISYECDELCLNDRILLIREMDEEIKDGDFVKRKIDEYLTEFELMPYIDNITFVTDRGSNMVTSLRNNNRVHCFAHLMNNTVGKMLEKLECVKRCSSIVHYFKRSGQSTLFGTTLKSLMTVRWNTVYYMIDSIIKHWQDISRILREKKTHLDDLAKISLDELKMLRALLEPFKKATAEIEGSSYPTLYLVSPWYEEIELHLTADATDSVFISPLKRVGLKYWQEIVRPLIGHYHDIAMFLHPLMKELITLTETRKQATYNKVSSMIDKFGGTSTSRRRAVEATHHLASSAMRRFVNANHESQHSEMDEYKECRVRNITNLLQWWDDKKAIFPALYKLARYIHAIPASSASAERIFSTAGKLCSNRPNMRSEMMDEILFLKSNYDLLDKSKREKQSIDDAGSDGYNSGNESN